MQLPSILQGESLTARMTIKKRDTKRRKRRLPLSVVGLSLSLAATASAEASALASAELAAGKPSRDAIIEEFSDVTMATFYIFDRENPGGLRRSGEQQYAQYRRYHRYRPGAVQVSPLVLDRGAKLRRGDACAREKLLRGDACVRSRGDACAGSTR
jgi:hypothetical protein